MVAAAMHPVRLDIAYEPGPLSTEATRCPADRHALVHRPPILAARLDAVIECDGLSATGDPDEGRGPVLVRPLPTACPRTGEISGARQLHYVERSAALYRAAALPVVATA